MRTHSDFSAVPCVTGNVLLQLAQSLSVLQTYMRLAQLQTDKRSDKKEVALGKPLLAKGTKAGNFSGRFNSERPIY